MLTDKQSNRIIKDIDRALSKLREDVCATFNVQIPKDIYEDPGDDNMYRNVQTERTHCKECLQTTMHQLKMDYDECGIPFAVASQCLSCGRYLSLEGEQPTKKD